MSTVVKKLYFHRTKDMNAEQLSSLCRGKTAKDRALYVGYEVVVEGDFDTRTGVFVARTLNGVSLITGVKL